MAWGDLKIGQRWGGLGTGVQNPRKKADGWGDRANAEVPRYSRIVTQLGAFSAGEGSWCGFPKLPGEQ
jgi:hypothetical protein